MVVYKLVRVVKVHVRVTAREDVLAHVEAVVQIPVRQIVKAIVVGAVLDRVKLLVCKHAQEHVQRPALEDVIMHVQVLVGIIAVVLVCTVVNIGTHSIIV